MDYEKRKCVAEKACKIAADTVLSYTGNTGERLKGAAQNAVTVADTESEKEISSLIKTEYPEDELLGEEFSPENTGNHSNLWIIDPLDGTNNYANGIPHYSISIAYAEHGEVKAGVVYDPVRGEIFSAVKGRGAFLNGRRILVSDKSKNSEAIVATGFYYDRSEVMEETLKTVKGIFTSGVRGIRRMGSAALDLVWTACGRFDAYFEYELSVWDFAAGMLIVKEAGGECMDPRGEELTLNSEGVIVSNKELLEWVKGVVVRK